MPDIDGLEVFRSIPNETTLPVIMLTARGNPMDRILGWKWVQMTICPNRLNRANCLPG
ncbi:hypothetical protein [Ruegeria sp. Ofav3-42]|uniref:hypothetical protein n=1 Tax=Ruegeria sp. Ofav3-42 TaxID=2917759 RepID=UPI001EF5CC72|nr:hypothetical protein [Ruegeria sp. Ofav3-42]MCG7522571.1 hypothetical protein [Ruegeria sp. Ofav3-42]